MTSRAPSPSSSSALVEFIAGYAGATVVDLLPGEGTFAPPPQITNADSATPIPAREGGPLVSLVKISSDDDGFSVIALHNPHRLSLAARERLFPLTLRYTMLAFAPAHLKDVDPATISDEDRQDHFDHTFGGTGVVFLIGRVMSRGFGVDADDEDGSNSAAQLSPAVEMVAHMNISFTTPSASLGDRAVLYVNGICCDPSFQGKGLARTILNEAVRCLRPRARYLTLRTMNVAVVKLMSAVGSGSAAAVPVYPVDAFDPAARPDLLVVAESLATEFGWTGLQASRLVIPKCYPPFLIPVFRGKSTGSELEAAVDAIINPEEGDAMCCIVDLV